MRRLLVLSLSAVLQPVEARAADEAGAVLSALHRTLGAPGAIGCLNPVLADPSIDDHDRAHAREGLAEEGLVRPDRATLRARIVADQTGSWGTPEESSRPLPADAERELVAAYADMAMRPPPQPTGRRLRAGLVDAGIRLAADCPARLDAPAIRGDWAFVARLSATAGHLHALRRINGRWVVVAHRFTFII